MDIKILIPDEKKNNFNEKRLDLLEKKLDQRYKNFIDNRQNEYVKSISNLQKSFMDRIDTLIKSNQNLVNQSNSKTLDNLRKDIDTKSQFIVQQKENVKENNKLMLALTEELSSLEDAIKNIKPISSIKYVNNGNDKLVKSFNAFYYKMQELLEQAKPRMYPSPS